MKMKKKTLLLAMLFVTVLSFSQSLIDTYKKGNVKLVVDETYANENDWGKVFETYYDTIYGTAMGNRKSIKILPDGSLIVNHEYRNFYSKFSATGKFENEFGIKNASGKRFEKTKPIEGIINQSFFTKLDNMGKMVCFDFDGNYEKTLTLNYATRQMIALPNNKIAVVGWVIWETKFRDFVAIVDYETNEQKVIWEHFTSRIKSTPTDDQLFSYTYEFEERGAFGFSSMPFSKSLGMNTPPMIHNIGNELIVSLANTGEIIRYSVEGKLISKDKIDWISNQITVEEQKEIQIKAINKYKSMKGQILATWVSKEENQKAINQLVSEMESDLKKISKPIQIPYFSTIIKDSDGNLLFFEYPKNDNQNQFNVRVFSEGGEFICKSSFESEQFDLAINPSKMVFNDGYIYALQKFKGAEGNPLRLVRFNLK